MSDSSPRVSRRRVLGTGAAALGTLAIGGHEEVLINVVKASKSLNYRPNGLIMHYGVTNPAYAQALGADADGTCGLVLWLPSVPYRDDVFGSAAFGDGANRQRHEP